MIRRGKISEAAILTEISFAAKAYWGYPQEYFDVWAAELTITADYIRDNDVFVFAEGGRVTGYYSLVELKDDVCIADARIERGFWLEHMFVRPHRIGKGIGTILFHHLRKVCETKGIACMGILADPNARGFYEKMGCSYQREYPSTIINRTTPCLFLELLKNR